MSQSVEGISSDAESLSSSSSHDAEFQPTEYPVMIWVAGRKITPGLVDTVSSNMRIFLNALGIPASAVLYYRLRATAVSGETSHLFVAVNEKEQVIRTPASQLSYITGMIDAEKLKQYTASITADPLGALLLKVGGGVGERINRFPPIFGFRAPRGEKQVHNRSQEIEGLRRDGYVALTLLPIAGIDHRLQLLTEIASLWGFALAAKDKNWPDLLVLRNESEGRQDLGGVPDQTWLHHALARVQEDHLPVVEIDGLWMGSLPRSEFLSESRARVLYAVLDWFRMRKLPYITARTFHCYVRRDLSAVVTLGSLRDRLQLTEWLEVYPYHRLGVARVTGETTAATVVFGSRPGSRDIAVRESTSDSWIVVRSPESSSSSKFSAKEVEQRLRDYYTDPATCGANGSPLTSADVTKMKYQDLLKIVRVAECDAAVSGVCMLNGSSSSATNWTASHKAYRAAVRSHVLRSHDTIGIYRTGPYTSPFFPSEMTPLPPDASRFRPMVSEISLAPEIGKPEDELLKSLMGTVWLLSVHEGDSEANIMYVSSDREAEEVRRLLFNAWKSGHLIGTWCRVMLTHKDSLSISVAGGTVDPLVAHAGDSIVDGNRWLDLTKKILSECTSS